MTQEIKRIPADLTVMEAMQKRLHAEAAILNAIRNFETVTGMRVRGISVDSATHVGGQPRIHGVELDVLL